MRIDHTKDIKKQVKEILISSLDSCSFYEPHESSLVIVKLCAYCKFSEFDGKNTFGSCTYIHELNRRSTGKK